MKVFSLRGQKKIAELVKKRQLKIAVVGLGKMGLPLAIAFALRDFSVLGVDINHRVVKKINSSFCPFPGEPDLPKQLEKVIKSKNLKATTNFSLAIEHADVVILLVPTLIDKERKPDLSALEKALNSVGKYLKKGTVVILESTVPPGTTSGIVKKKLEKISSLKSGVDFGLAFCPERTNSGTALKDIGGRLNPKIVGGLEMKSRLIAKLLYQQINKKGVVEVSSLTMAEMVKLSEMIYRDVKIAYANSLALICAQLKIDVQELIAATNTDVGCQILKPGAGVGGHCIPVYPHFLISRKLKQLDLLKSSRKINDTMPSFVVQRVMEALKECNLQIKRSSCLVLGIAYRGGVKEIRFSPGIEICKLLKKKGLEVFVFDPLFEKKEMEDLGLKYKADFKGIDCLVLATLHEEFKKIDLEILTREMKNKIFVDTTFHFQIKDFRQKGFIFKNLSYNFSRNE